MSVAVTSFTEIAGDDLRYEFTVTDSDDNTQDLTGATARYQIARTRGDDPVIDTESSPATATATISDAANGQFQVDIAGDDTTDLSGTYWFEAELEDSGGNKSTVARGYITFEAQLVS